MIKKEWLWINDLNKNKMDNNKLIAEFMGLSIKEGVSYYTDQDDMFFMGVEVEEPYLPFDEDWNWLMCVVDKIEDYLSDNVGEVGYFDDGLVSNDIEVRYQAVVEFIKEYNKYICGSCGDQVNEVVFNEDTDVDECTNCIQ